MKLKTKHKAKKTPILNESPKFQHYRSYDDYETAHIKGIEPMTAKEIAEDKQDTEFNNPNNYIEEKFDGTRGILHFYKVDPFISKTFKNKPIEFKALVYDLLNGTGFQNGNERVYNYFTKTAYDRKKMALFLKNEYGIGGHTTLPTPENFEVGNNHNAKGIDIVVARPNDCWEDYKHFTFEWEQVADVIKDLIEDGIYYSQKAYTRCFSRRVSKQTNWYCENTDSLPHLRDTCIPELAGTIIDGEMFIPNRPFKDVSGTLNCLYDKAIERQKELGLIVFHAFDIIYYKGRCVEKLPLWKRKELLAEVVKLVDSPYIINVTCQSCTIGVKTYFYEKSHGDIFDVYINLLNEGKETSYPAFMTEMSIKSSDSPHTLSPKALYEYIVATGGEGVILKPKDGKYYHKRGREYQKVKKFLTRELIICGFTEPTKEYTGKFPNDMWSYWVNSSNNKKVHIEDAENSKASYLINKGYTPVTRHYYENQVGQLILGILITNEELGEIPYNKQGTLYDPEIVGLKVEEGTLLMQVCECSGFDDAQRQVFTLEKNDYLGAVAEVKANEIFKDTGKMRHPRFLRIRADKNANQCIWKDHIGE